MASYCYEYPRPMLTVDIIITATDHSIPHILFIQRGKEPFMNMYALPGGFIEMHEDLIESAVRELIEETGLDIAELHQFKTYGTPGRDPRGRTISVVFYCDTLSFIPPTTAGDDAAQTQWFPLNQIPPLAFDHNKIIDDFVHHYFNNNL